MADQRKRALVVFSENSDLFFLKFLRKGFRHAFLMIKDGDSWISVDPLFTNMIIQIEKTIKDEGQFIKWLQQNNYTVVETDMNNPPGFSCPGFCTCVGAIKRILGVRGLFVWTPYQLYKFLNNKKNKKERALWVA